ncbi:MAG: bifunctional (p)ppGpp synthetase/guanosine-3',5'-bis(diphosphate) 3'-pyrophosphohydrolase [Spirochaetales bacterium]|nr:bifunctional (p)ppGpp synthetase/guanosine-3',5'-bis(diphosphate) 3'-pyrophosphohydrolase [Spirochaetales bacterium]
MEKNALFDAVKFAVKAHHGQFRKGSMLPYIFHPLNVGRLLIEYNYPIDLVIAGFLHDTLEDTMVTVEEIENTFNKRIALLVENVSEKNKASSWENRKTETLENLRSAEADVLAVACADKLDNLRSMKKDFLTAGEELWRRFNRPREKQAWYYTSLASVFEERMKGISPFPMAAVFIREVKSFFVPTV